MIKTKDISVVVQGAIDYAVINDCIKSIRSALPGCEIVLSTWENTDVSGIDYDILVLNKDPGAYLHYLKNDINVPVNMRKLYNNTSRQIVSSLNGIIKANRKYVLKWRNDLFLKNKKFLLYFNRFNKRNKSCCILNKRVIVSTATKDPSFLPFHCGDWVFFGLKEDVLNIFDIPLPKEPDNTYYFYKNPSNSIRDSHICRFFRVQYLPEQWIWSRFLLKYIDLKFDNMFDITDENIELTNLSFANNLVILSPNDFKFFSLKYRDWPNKLDYGYDFRNWFFLYIKYCYPFLFIFISDKFLSKKFKHLNKELKKFYSSISSFVKPLVSLFNAFIYFVLILFYIIIYPLIMCKRLLKK